MTYDVVKMGDNTYQTSAVPSQLVVMSNRSSYSIPSSRFTMVDTRPRPTAVIQKPDLSSRKPPVDPCTLPSLAHRPWIRNDGFNE
jgi:hypothetical protein